MLMLNHFTSEDVYEAVNLAQLWIKNNMAGKEWPGDDWHDLSERWSLNLWNDTGADGKPVPLATVYPIEQGQDGYVEDNVHVWIRVPLGVFEWQSINIMTC